jgi:periplasmic divalent cation tolerance protein
MIVTVYAVFGSAAEAQVISRAVVEERLAACANILAPCRSIYRWQGSMQEDERVPALFKTRADTADTLIARIAALQQLRHSCRRHVADRANPAPLTRSG